jgi:hypothetical protein
MKGGWVEGRTGIKRQEQQQILQRGLPRVTRRYSTGEMGSDKQPMGGGRSIIMIQTPADYAGAAPARHQGAAGGSAAGGRFASPLRRARAA